MNERIKAIAKHSARLLGVALYWVCVSVLALCVMTTLQSSFRFFEAAGIPITTPLAILIGALAIAYAINKAAREVEVNTTIHTTSIEDYHANDGSRTDVHIKYAILRNSEADENDH